MTPDQLSDHLGSAAERQIGYAVTSGFEDLDKVGDNAWRFKDEDGTTYDLADAEADVTLEEVFPGS